MMHEFSIGSIVKIRDYDSIPADKKVKSAEGDPSLITGKKLVSAASSRRRNDMARLTSRDEYGNAEIIALEDITPQLYEGLSFNETNALTYALNKLADYEDADEKENAEREKPCYGCKFYVARKLLNKVVDERFTEEMREFLLLVLENPELPVVPMVDGDCVGGDE